MRVKCIDNSDAIGLLTKNKIYKVKDEKGNFYRLEYDDQGVITEWLKNRFEIIKENKQSGDEAMKIYFRDDKGKFCTAKTFFASQNEIPSFSTNSDFTKAEEQNKKLVDNYIKNQDNICLLIMGANEVIENGCNDNNHLNISFSRYGRCSIQYSNSHTGGSRKEILERVFAKIEQIIEVQKIYMDKANARYIEL